MAGVGSRGPGRAILAAVIVAGAAASFGASPTHAAEESFTLPGDVMGLATIDLDGRPGREIVRVTTDPDDSSRVAIEAWAYDDGWSRMGSAAVMRATDEGDVLVHANPFSDVVSLVSWTVDGENRLLVFTAGGDPGLSEGRPGACCIMIFELRLGPGGLELHRRSDSLGDLEQAAILDLDADGTDEIVATPPLAGSPMSAMVLDWTGTRFEPTGRVALPEGFQGGFNIALADVDGFPGEEAILGPTELGAYVRLTLDETGTPKLETAFVGRPGGFSWIAGAVDGRLLSIGEAIRLIEWPRGMEPTIVESVSSTEYPSLNVLANGDEAVLIDLGEYYGYGPMATTEGATVLDLSFQPIREIPPGDAATALSELPSTVVTVFDNREHNLYPYVGPLPGGLEDGREAFLYHDTMITLDPAGELDVQTISAFIGSNPVGVAGPDGSWIVASDWFYGSFSPVVYFFPVGAGGGEATLIPIEDVLRPDRVEVAAAPVLRNAVTVTEDDGSERVLAADGGFEVVVDGPPGTVVVAVVNQSIVHDGELEGAPLTLTMAPRRARDTNQSYEAAILMISPSGRPSAVSWQAEILREPPELSATAETQTLALAARVEGQADAGATVTVGGAPVRVDEDGTFAAEVSVGPWPQQLLVVATDPVGNESVEMLSVVGVFDYRGLPWALIVGAVTVAFGIVLFARTPGRRRPETAPAFGDGRLEEIDAD